MIRFSRIVCSAYLSRPNRGICKRYMLSIQKVLSGAKYFLRKREWRVWPERSLPIFVASQFTSINIEDQDKDEREDVSNQPNIFNSIQEACNNSLNATMDFLNVTFDAISSSAIQYKSALHDLYSCLEKYEASKEFSDALLEELVDAVIGARARVFDCEREYLELITVMGSIEKVTKSISELSFLMREEALALTLTETLHSVQESIELDSAEIKNMKKKFYKFENEIFSNAEINNSNVEIKSGKLET